MKSTSIAAISILITLAAHADAKLQEWNPHRIVVLLQRDESGVCRWPDVGQYGLRYKMRGLESKRHCGIGILEIDKSNTKTAAECMEELLLYAEFEDVHLDYLVSAEQILDNVSSGDELTLSTLWPAQTQDLSQLVIDIQNVSPATPNDPAWSEQWNVRQVRGDFTIGLGTQGLGVVVAVVDSGCNVNHPDLRDNVWTNDAEINGIDGVDDDGNGFVDDKYGFNFIDDNGDVSDPSGHGTHVASIIGAVTNNQQGIAGMAANSKIMCLKFLNNDGLGSVSDAIMAMSYAVQMKAHIQNHSWGGQGQAPGLVRAVQVSGEYGNLHVAAAGNANLNEDIPENLIIPAGISNSALYPEESQYIISVAATDINDELAFFSNYGESSVDLAAPGVNIAGLASVITDANNGVAVYSGTSQATPHVTAAAAMVLSVLAARPSAGVYNTDDMTLNPDVVKQVLTMTVDRFASLESLLVTGGRLNAFSAIQFAITGNAADIRIVDDTNPVPIWAWILIAFVAIGALFACMILWIFAYAWRTKPPKDEPLIYMSQVSSAPFPRA